MLCVEVNVKPSKIHGYGVFAKNDIPKGTILWETKTDFDRKFDKKYYDNLNDVQKTFVQRTFSTYDKYFHSYCDYAIFTNHSYSCNVIPINETCAVAGKDIKAGEELTQNYGDTVFHI
jgi:SET domain-containing protein